MEIEELFGADVYPDTSNLVLGMATRKCWIKEYKATRDMLLGIVNTRDS